MCNRRSQDAGNLSPLRSLFADGGAGGQAYRCAAAADRTGHAILHTLYGMVPLAKCHRLHGLRSHQFWVHGGSCRFSNSGNGVKLATRSS